MKILVATILATVFLFLTHPKIAADIDWGKDFKRMAEPAHYSPPDYTADFMDLAHQWRSNIIRRITQDKDMADFNLLALLPPFKQTEEQAKLKELNDNVNKAFKYWSGPLNWWYAEPPIVSMMIGGDCKAYAYFKYWALRQMGYTNVKLVTVVLPDGRGSLAGHVVVVLNDIMVFDINYPYYYPFEVLRENNALEEAFFPDGSIWDVE